MPECYCDSVTHPNGECMANYAIPDRSGPYFTKGKKYQIRNGIGNLYAVTDDLGHERYLSKQDGVPCPHLPPLGNLQHHRCFSSEHLGQWKYMAN